MLIGSGWAAIHWVDVHTEGYANGYTDVQQTGIGRYATEAEAVEEALQWSDSDGIPLIDELQLRYIASNGWRYGTKLERNLANLAIRMQHRSERSAEKSRSAFDRLHVRWHIDNKADWLFHSRNAAEHALDARTALGVEE